MMSNNPFDPANGAAQTTGQPGTDGAGAGKDGPAGSPGVTAKAADQGGEPKTPPDPNALSLEPKTPAEPEYTPADTGNVALDLALDYFAKLGIKDGDPALDRAKDGDFALLEAKLAVLGDKAKGHEKYLALGKTAYESAKSAADAKVAATLKVVHEAAGGEEQWNAIKTWVGQNADPAERATLTAGINQGGLVAKAVVAYLSNLYNSKVGKQPDPAVRKDASGKAPAGVPLSARAYSDEVAALYSRLGVNMETSPEYAALNARRNAARAAGY
jgi:hypothetical protein